MSEIVIRKELDKWGAFVQDRRIAIGNCQSCVVKVVLAVTKNSTRYKTIVVHNEDNSVRYYLPTGV